MIKRTVLILALFAATWLLWSGVYVPLTLALGALSCIAVTVLAVRIGFVDSEVYALHFGRRLPGYWLWLLWEIVKANVKVARIVLSPRLPIEPTVTSVDAHELDPVSQATLANSITLTPGTLSMDVNRGRIEVHCLTREIGDELREGEMHRRVAALSGS